MRTRPSDPNWANCGENVVLLSEVEEREMLTGMIIGVRVKDKSAREPLPGARRRVATRGRGTNAPVAQHVRLGTRNCG